MHGRPILGRPATLRVRMLPELIDAKFELVSMDAQPLQALELDSLGDGEFVGKPPWRIVSCGCDGP